MNKFFNEHQFSIFSQVAHNVKNFDDEKKLLCQKRPMNHFKHIECATLVFVTHFLIVRHL